jgi:NADH-quinone oxidoreductase subunit M
MTNVPNFPILSLVLFLPLAGALILLFVPRRAEQAIRWIANLFGLAGFLASVPLWFWYDPQNPQYQFVERLPWIPSIGAEYFLGVDGFSVLLILLTTLMGAIAILSSWTAIGERVKEYYTFMLVLQTGMLGAFMALDFLLFFLFWEVMLVPMYFLIGIWGSDRRLYSAIKFFLYTLVGSVVMLLGILALYFAYHEQTGVYTFDITRFQQFNFDRDLQKWVFLAFFLGFAIKVPMFPFHTWLPDAHTDAPTAGSVILAAILLKMGTYGFIRFSLPILPDATRSFVPMMVGLAIVGIIYGALVAMAQRDWKRLVAYSSVSHMGMVMLGMFALTPVGITGSIVQQINHGISTGALFLIVGIVYERRHTREIAEYGGLSKVMPVYATIFMIMTMSSIGLPGLNGFIGELLVLQGVYVVNKLWAALAASGIVLGASYMLWLYQRTMFGKVDNPRNQRLADLNLREVATFAPLVVLAFWIGLYPSPFLRRLETSVDRVMARVDTRYTPRFARADCAPGSSTQGGAVAAVVRADSPAAFTIQPCAEPTASPSAAAGSEVVSAGRASAPPKAHDAASASAGASGAAREEPR